MEMSCPTRTTWSCDHQADRFFFLLRTDPCLTVMPPCMGEADRFSLEALRHIHKQLDDDNDGGIEVNESVEVSTDAMQSQVLGYKAQAHEIIALL